MSKNRDKESDKEIALAKKDRVAKNKEFGLGPEDMVQEVIEKIVEVSVDNPELTKDLKKAVLNLQEANDLLEFKDDQIKTLGLQLEKNIEELKKQDFEIKELHALIDKAVEKNESNTIIIKGLEAKNLKLKEAVKQLSE